MQEICITENEAGQRLDKLLAKYLNGAPKSFYYKMLRKKNITLNGKKASGSEKLVEGDLVKLYLSDETIGKFSGKTFMARLGRQEKLDILFEDENLLLLDKPVGMLSQKAKETDVSAVEHLIRYLLDTGQLTEQNLKTFRPSVCNRLDRNTSGILVAGKSLAGLQEMSRFFKERTVGKYYLCLAFGRIKEEKSIKGYLYKEEEDNHVRICQDEHPGSVRIETEYRPLASGKDVTLLEVHLITGKTHQIRAHLAAHGHPIIGDHKYGIRKVNDSYQKEYGLRSQLLHAWRIQMPDSEGPLQYLSGREFTALPPAIFRHICMEKLPSYHQKEDRCHGNMEFPWIERLHSGRPYQPHE